MRLLRFIFAPRHMALLLSMLFFAWILAAMALHPERGACSRFRWSCSAR